MSDMVVVYESNEPFWAEELMKALREEGFHPELADDAGTAYYSMDNKNPGMSFCLESTVEVVYTGILGICVPLIHTCWNRIMVLLWELYYLERIPHETHKEGFYAYRTARGDRNHCVADGHLVAGTAACPKAGEKNCLRQSGATTNYGVADVCPTERW